MDLQLSRGVLVQIIAACVLAISVGWAIPALDALGRGVPLTGRYEARVRQGTVSMQVGQTLLLTTPPGMAAAIVLVSTVWLKRS